MDYPLMPKATAVWLLENTALTFDQIAEFCGLHALEIQAMADGDVGSRMVGHNPIFAGQLTKNEIERCEKDENTKLQLKVSSVSDIHKRRKGARYTPVSRRQDKPDAISWLIKHHPELSDNQVCKLIGTTKKTIEAIRDKTHWNSSNLKAKNPVILGLCKEVDIEKAVAVASRKKK
ncbi:MAG: DUF1013 domain-containing protein [Alphaproteobacteria bacterium]|nr:DUF1013 domain-containing protein [Alphaproteobacteria bacterium]